MRCCNCPSLLAAASALMLASSSLSSAAASVATERVLVLGARQDLVHDNIAAESNPSSLLAAFTPAGLAQLAMDAFGLPTGNLVYLSSGGEADAATQYERVQVNSPVQADLFTHVDAYAMIHVDKADAVVLDAIDTTTTTGYHKLFDLTEEDGPAVKKIPAVLARELAAQNAGSKTGILCAGSDTVCPSNVLPAVEVTDAQVNAVFTTHQFLDRTRGADAVLAKELAQTQQLTKTISASQQATSSSSGSLYVVGFSGVSALSSEKHTLAREAVATQIQKLLLALQTAYPRTSGAQIVAAKRGIVTAFDSTIAYSRMLLSFNAETAGSADDDESSSGSGDADASNSTTSDISMEDIAEYQIILWTSVLLVVALLLVIIAMCNMEPKRDSLLYAKFTTSNSGRKYD